MAKTVPKPSRPAKPAAAERSRPASREEPHLVHAGPGIYDLPGGMWGQLAVRGRPDQLVPGIDAASDPTGAEQHLRSSVFLFFCQRAAHASFNSLLTLVKRWERDADALDLVAARARQQAHPALSLPNFGYGVSQIEDEAQASASRALSGAAQENIAAGIAHPLGDWCAKMHYQSGLEVRNLSDAAAISARAARLRSHAAQIRASYLPLAGLAGRLRQSNALDGGRLPDVALRLLAQMEITGRGRKPVDVAKLVVDRLLVARRTRWTSDGTPADDIGVPGFPEGVKFAKLGGDRGLRYRLQLERAWKERLRKAASKPPLFVIKA